MVTQFLAISFYWLIKSRGILGSKRKTPSIALPFLLKFRLTNGRTSKGWNFDGISLVDSFKQFFV
jgi:hypothetical protein